MRALIAAFVLAAGATVTAAPADDYHLVKEIQLGGEGGWNYVSVDAQAHRLGMN